MRYRSITKYWNMRPPIQTYSSGSGDQTTIVRFLAREEAASEETLQGIQIEATHSHVLNLSPYLVMPCHALIAAPPLDARALVTVTGAHDKPVA